MSVKKRVFGFVMAMVMMLGITPVAFATEDLNGGYALSLANQSVYSSASGGSRIGSIYRNEGITVLWTSGNVAKIDYSTSSGTKQGYLYNPNYRLYVGSNYPALNNSSVAWMDYTTTVYYGPSTSGYQTAGTVYGGEYVAALGASNGWTYIEYNTSSGRKRGYVPSASITVNYWNRLDGNLKDTSAITNGSQWISGRKNIYSGPSTQYFCVGYVQDENVIKYDRLYTDADGNYFQYIEYYVNGTSNKKSGFMPW